MSGCAQRDAGCDEEAAYSAYYDEAGSAGYSIALTRRSITPMIWLVSSGGGPSRRGGSNRIARELGRRVLQWRDPNLLQLDGAAFRKPRSGDHPTRCAA